MGDLCRYFEAIIIFRHRCTGIDSIQVDYYEDGEKEDINSTEEHNNESQMKNESTLNGVSSLKANVKNKINIQKKTPANK